MKKFTFIFVFLFSLHSIMAQLHLTEVGTLPVSVANNAVVEGYIDGTPYLFSFGGIDSTKSHAGIHLKSFRYNIETGETLQLPDLPDDMGKIACAASRIGNIIYISGGYHVFSSGSELSSAKMHRYDIINNVFLEDAPDIPKSTDDHVQVVWRDSLIYLITGWSDFTNIPNVQIYNPTTNSWTDGTFLPNNNNYKSFGASGVIFNDTIYYYGGVSSGAGFPIQNQLRKGIINPDNSTQIEWSISTPDPTIRGYRMAATVVNNQLHWVGGSTVAYNFDGIAYNGSGGVPPSNRDLFTDVDNVEWRSNIVEGLPMDLRGIAEISDTVKYLAGGMLAGQSVSNKVFRLEWNTEMVNDIKRIEKEGDFAVFPNPFEDKIRIRALQEGLMPEQIVLYDARGRMVKMVEAAGTEALFSTSTLPSGVYFLKIRTRLNIYIEQMIKK